MPVQYSRLAGTAWTLWPAILYDPPVPTLELTDDELRDAAQAARVAAAQAQMDAAAPGFPVGRMLASPVTKLRSIRAVKLCAIDEAVLAAQKAGEDWRTVRGIRSRRQFLRVLARARWRAAH
jgi:hypothetical protein